tara:strand:+ start:63 stop:575 length:513 start_codon:yes stop_codon:yes gene_type:complete
MIVLSIGSNLPSSFGDRFQNINYAIAYLEKYEIKIIKKSNFYESPSQPNIDDPKFINIVIGVTTNLDAENLASVLLFVEEKLERKRGIKNSSRTCDIDIIDFNGEVKNFKYNNLDFLVPHEKLSLRNFVLYPLQEILPKWKHPKTGIYIDKLIENISAEDKKSILKIDKP